MATSTVITSTAGASATASAVTTVSERGASHALSSGRGEDAVDELVAWAAGSAVPMPTAMRSRWTNHGTAA